MKEDKTPFAIRLLRQFCPQQLREEIEGDLLQKFERDTKIAGHRKAVRTLFWNVIRFFRPGILLRNRFQSDFNTSHMLRHNLILSFRQMKKDLTFTVINILGLSTSMAACFLIFQYALFELSYDRQLRDYQQVYRVTTTSYEGNFPRYPSALSSRDLAPALKEKLPEVLEAARICTIDWFDCTMSYTQKDQFVIFNEKKLRFADQNFLSLFHEELLQGNAKTALSEPFSVVVSISKAKKYFGEEEALGKTLHLKGSGDEHDYTVTGVMSNPAPNSHIEADMLLSVNSISGKSTMPYLNVYTYVVLNKDVDEERLAAKLQPIANLVSPPKDNFHSALTLQPIANIHLHSHLQDELKPNSSATSIYFLMAIAFVVLTIAWINYINLTTARAVLRAKEVGIRKVTGATRKQIVLQFMTGAMLINGIALLCALVSVRAFAPVFYHFVGLSFPYQEILNWNVGEVVAILLLALFGGICIAGILPARIISSFNPVKVLKGSGLQTQRGFSFRQAAVVFQFTCTIVLLVAVFAFNRQFDFLRSQDLGIDITKTVIAKSPSNVDSSYHSQFNGFKNYLKEMTIIQSAATSAAVPGNTTDGWTGVIRREKDKATLDFGIYVIDADFIDTYKLKLLAGRNFQHADYPLKTFGEKLESVILNRTATQRLGFKEPDDAVGEFVYWGLRTEASKCVVVGVIEDYRQESLKESIKPLFYVALNGPTMTLKLTTAANKNINQTLRIIRNAWIHFFPSNPFDYSFLEDDYNKHYEGDKQIAKLFNLFCVLAIIISCLGILALSLFSIGRRVKEISIRKVLGASVLNLVRLLTKEYLILIGVASIIALPISYWGIQQWLNEFATKVHFNMMFFLLPIAVIVTVALTTVGGQALRAAWRNPAENLKHE